MKDISTRLAQGMGQEQEPLRDAPEGTSLARCARNTCLFSLAAITLFWAGCGAREVNTPVRWIEDPGYVEYPYPLDGESRKAPSRGKLDCPIVQLVEYDGDVVAYHRTVKVNPFFRERLQRFEEVVYAVAMDVYGRPPRAIRHFGTYNCRRVRGKAKLSEHAFGNAIDVAGFDFDPHPKGRGPVPGEFRIVLENHWGKRTGDAKHHARFLHELSVELSKRPDIFRGMLGPGAPGHADHFHFDVGPYRYIDIGGL